MIKNDSLVVQKIKKNIFMATDVIALELTIEKLVPIEKSAAPILDVCPEVVEEIESFLTQGPTWEFNPTTQHLCDEPEKELCINRQKLTEYIKKESVIIVKELDVHTNVAIITTPVKLLIANARTLPNELIDRSSFCKVTTLFGEISL